MKRRKLSESEQNTLNIPISSLEELRCIKCKGYLSCSPVHSLPNGECICGRCSLLKTRTHTHRLVAIESFLCQLSFPCIFRKYGCAEMLKYGETLNHELKCVYKPFVCPVKKKCLWEGTASGLLDHLNDMHPGIFKNKVEFKLEVDKDAHDVLIGTENSFTFILKYFYTARERILKYDVRLCTDKNGFEVFFKVQLINGVDSDCNMNLKMSECCLYDKSFPKMQNAKVLHLNKGLEYLGEPDCIVVAVKLKVVNSNDSNAPPEDRHERNSDLIESLVCYICQNYLIPPLFRFNGKAICCDCADDSNCKPLIDTDLVKRVNEAMYPCRWQDCNVLSKSSNFKSHDSNCPFRLHCCVYSDCDVVFKLSAAIDHLQSHEYNTTICVNGGITYKTAFACSDGRHDIITIKNNRIILIQHETLDLAAPYTHRVNVFGTPGDSAEITGTVVFEHAHCKLKSKEFIVNTSKNLDITLKDLPACFKEKDKLSVTMELIA